MDIKEKKVSECFKDFRDLPVKARVEAIKTAKEILEIQEGNKSFIESVTDPSAYADGKRK